MAGRTRLALAAMFGTSSLLVARVAAAGGSWPNLPWDPETNPSCVTWSTPQPDQTCEEFIKFFTMTPAEFHGYNPNIGLDCSGWIEQQSYCIADKARDAQFWATATDPYWTSMRPTSTSATATTTTTTYTTDGTPVPSPLVWRPASCYHTGLEPFGAGQVLEKQLIKGDKTLTTQKCFARCWDAMPSKRLTLAGLRNGDECWCGSVLVESFNTSGDYNGCNMTCSGDPTQIQCGGK
ncbi:WSC domain-containing protein [Microdochium nivale]|nr:WSC domain-containing protein [Microdochium nivale]